MADVCQLIVILKVATILEPPASFLCGYSCEACIYELLLRKLTILEVPKIPPEICLDTTKTFFDWAEIRRIRRKEEQTIA